MGLLGLAALLALVSWIMAREMRLRPGAGIFRAVALGFLPFAGLNFFSLAALEREPQAWEAAKKLFEGEFFRLMLKSGSALNEGQLKELSTLLFKVQAGLNCVVWLALVTALAALIRSRLVKKGKVIPSKSMTRWKAPDLLIWVVLLPGALLLFGKRGWLGEVEPWLQASGLNILVLMGAVYLFQGFLVVAERLNQWGVPKPAALLLASSLVLLAASPKGAGLAFGVLALGLFETWFDFRGLIAPDKEDSERRKP